MVLALVRLAAIVVRVDEGGMVVLVLVVVGPMLELTERATGVVVRDVVVVVRMHGRRVRVLVFDVTRDTLHGLLGHDRTSRYWESQDPTVPRTA
jgi:hypothetical protein